MNFSDSWRVLFTNWQFGSENCGSFLSLKMLKCSGITYEGILGISQGDDLKTDC
jgi:hypothetical protein